MGISSECFFFYYSATETIPKKSYFLCNCSYKFVKSNRPFIVQCSKRSIWPIEIAEETEIDIFFAMTIRIGSIFIILVLILISNSFGHPNAHSAKRDQIVSLSQPNQHKAPWISFICRYIQNRAKFDAI